MRKSCLIGIFTISRYSLKALSPFHQSVQRIGLAAIVFHAVCFSSLPTVSAQDATEKSAAVAGDEEAVEKEKDEETEKEIVGEKAKAKEKEATVGAQEYPADYWADATSPVYPRSVSFSGDSVFVVDSDAHGVWSVPLEGDRPSKPSLYATGSRYLRKIMNRPFSAVAHPQVGVLVGDSATREIYHVTPDPNGLLGQNSVPLNNGYLGIPMALAVSPDKTKIYVGDAERRALFELPIGGGKPELVARVNARGLVFDADGHLWAVTPDAEAVYRVDVAAKKAEPVVTGRPYGYPGGIAWVDDGENSIGYVSDVYEKCIWQFTADGKTEKWFEGDLLIGPVGMSATKEAVWVSDPKAKQVYQIDRSDKKVTPILTAK